MKRRIATFESFKQNESLEYGDDAPHRDPMLFPLSHGDDATSQDIKIYDEDQHEEFLDHLDELASKYQVEIHWDLGKKEHWDSYVKHNRKFAVIVTNEKSMGKHFIGALLDEDGEVIMSLYNNDTPCPKEVAEGYLNDMQMFHKENNTWESDQEVCSNCDYGCDKCECDNCDCSDDWKESDDMKFEYYAYDTTIADDLVKAVKSNNLRNAEALVESGADISHRRYLAIKKAIENRNPSMLEMLFSELDENEIESDDAEEILEACEIYSAPASINRLVKSYLSKLAYPMNEKKKAAASSYKKSGLKNPGKADLNKDKKISGYEKARGKAVQKNVQDEKEEKGTKGLTAKQKKLPEGLRKAIEKRMKGKK